MMKKGCLLLCATALSLAWLDNQAQASIGFNLKAPPVPSHAKLHTSHTSHLMARHLSSPSFSERPEVKVAQVCFITDTEDCGGADFVGTDGTQGTPPDVYFAECIPDCPSDYKTCQSPQQGVGTVCAGNMYEDCCTPTCGDEYKYDASNVPAGYELVGEPCMACEDGGSKAKYKDIEEKDCTGFVDCGLSGCKSGTPTCQSGSQIKCSECEAFEQ